MLAGGPPAPFCAGDCNGNNMVSALELFNVTCRSVNCGGDPLVACACGSTVPSCARGDRSGNGTISATEIFQATQNSIDPGVRDECPPPAGETPTSTATPTEIPPTETAIPATATPPAPSATPTITPTPVPAVCGNGMIEPPETCDDGNTMTNDACPPDCDIQVCTAAGTTVTAQVNFAVPAGSNVASLTVLIEYPDGAVQIPGTGADPSVGMRITNRPGGRLVDGVDLDYALRVGVAGTAAIPAGQLFRVNFDACMDASPPTAGQFTCTVLSAFNTSFQSVTGVTCSVALL
jgi:cysteine-rich repeat protein